MLGRACTRSFHGRHTFSVLSAKLFFQNAFHRVPIAIALFGRNPGSCDFIKPAGDDLPRAKTSWNDLGLAVSLPIGKHLHAEHFYHPYFFGRANILQKPEAMADL